MYKNNNTIPEECIFGDKSVLGGLCTRLVALNISRGRIPSLC